MKNINDNLHQAIAALCHQGNGGGGSIGSSYRLPPPVYARNADEALRLCNSAIWVDQGDDWDSEWQLGDTVPEVMDLEYIKDRYNHFITRDGVVSRDEIQERDRISEEWHKKHDKE